MQVTLLPAMCLFEVLKAIFVTGGCQQAAHTEDTAGRQPSIHIAFSIASVMCICCEVKSQGVVFFKCSIKTHRVTWVHSQCHSQSMCVDGCLKSPLVDGRSADSDKNVFPKALSPNTAGQGPINSNAVECFSSVALGYRK
jgi:hypothetical protein